ncbi:MAG: hypothetical protein H0W06_06390 [Chloroflexia bacterium]|nr:hypothetical protein [Chloroflexia bacterium]
MVIPFARLKTKIVTCVSCTQAPDGKHEHVAFLTVRTPAGHNQRVTVPDAVVQLRHPLGERYLAHAPRSGDRIEVVLGPCPVCRLEPYIRLKGGGQLEELTRCP